MSSVGASLEGSSAPKWVKDKIDTSPLGVAAVLATVGVGWCFCCCFLLCRYRGRVREAAARQRALDEQRRDATIGLVRPELDLDRGHGRGYGRGLDRDYDRGYGRGYDRGYDRDRVRPERHHRLARTIPLRPKRIRAMALRRAAHLDELDDAY